MDFCRPFDLEPFKPNASETTSFMFKRKQISLFILIYRFIFQPRKSQTKQSRAKQWLKEAAAENVEASGAGSVGEGEGEAWTVS